MERSVAELGGYGFTRSLYSFCAFTPPYFTSIILFLLFDRMNGRHQHDLNTHDTEQPSLALFLHTRSQIIFRMRVDPSRRGPAERRRSQLQQQMGR